MPLFLVVLRSFLAPLVTLVFLEDPVMDPGNHSVTLLCLLRGQRASGRRSGSQLSVDRWLCMNQSGHLWISMDRR